VRIVAISLDFTRYFLSGAVSQFAVSGFHAKKKNTLRFPGHQIVAGTARAATHVYVYICIYICVICMCVCVCMHACMYLYTYIHVTS